MNSKINTKANTFSVEQTTVLKGIGILMILFHNYLVYQPDSFFFNEESFKAENLPKFLNNLWPTQWYESFSALCVFFGHYGVQLFIFCTAYGLFRVYQKKPLTHYKRDLKKRLSKLLVLIGLGIVCYLIYHYFHYGKLYPPKLILKNFVLLLTTAGVFNKDWLYSMFSGPFWYFGLTIQLYLLYPFLHRIFMKLGVTKCIILAYLLIYPLYYWDYQSQFTVFGNLLGHLPEVILAFYLAKNGLSALRLPVILAALLLYPLTQYSIYFYPLSFVCILILMIAVFKWAVPKLPQLAYNNLLYIGEISMIIFILNGFLRFASFVHISNSILRAERIFLYAILVIIISHFVNKIYLLLLKRYNLSS